MAMDIGETRSRPLYMEVAERLRGRVRDGTFSPGKRLPSEEALREEFGVSRVTIRKALAVLLEEALLVRRGERGVVVNADPAPGPRPAAAAFPGVQVFFHVRDLVNQFQLSSNFPIWLQKHPSLTFTSLPRGKTFAEFAEKNPGGVMERIVFYAGYEPTPEDEAWVKRLGVSAVVIGRGRPGCGLPRINANHRVCGETMTRHLLSLGHERILLVLEVGRHVASEGLLEGYRNALERHGAVFDPRRVVVGDELAAAERGGNAPSSGDAASFPMATLMRGGERCADEALRRDPSATAMIVQWEWTILGAMNELRRRRIRVPEDMAVVCYGYRPWLDGLVDTPLTGFNSSVDELMGLAFDELDAMRRGETVPPDRIVEDPPMIVRRSCGAYR